MADRHRVHREVERKLRVAPDFVLLDLVAHGAVARVIPGQPFEMAADYHDTVDLRLLRWGVTLRRREGGEDQGWHLKMPVVGSDRSTRDELHLPLWAGSTGAVPAELADIVSPLSRGERLVPVARVHTTRVPSILVGLDGAEVAELVDDQVQVRSPEGQLVAAFREIEIEARNQGADGASEVPADREVIDRIALALVEHGAEPSDASKAAAALGERASAPPDIDVGPPPGGHDSARDALAWIIALHARHLVLADIAVRRDLPDAVHQLRVAARRLRSVLRTFEPLLDSTWARTVEEELSWLSSEMGMVRDTEVLVTGIDACADALGEPDSSLVRAALGEVLLRRLEGARGGALAALRSERHDLLLEDLVLGAQQPPVTTQAEAPARVILPRLAEAAWQRLERSARKLEMDSAPDAWHRVRIRAKRARYAVEAIEPVIAHGSRRLGKRLAEATEVLGEHQDAHLAQELLRQTSAREGTAAPTAFALGRLFDLQVARERQCRTAFAHLWPSVRQAAKHAPWT